MKYKQHGRVGLFDRDETGIKLKKLGNLLEKLHNVIDFELFRSELESELLNHDKKNNSGCKPYDVVLMFKIVLLKRFYNMSDEQAEYQINDRLSFREFLGLSSGDRVPDERTIWLFQERLIQNDLAETLFSQFRNHPDLSGLLGLLVNEGKIVDASFVEVPRRRNDKDENKQIKSGGGADLWSDRPAKKRQKDIDARRTEKGGQKFFGYKDHVKIDGGSKLIDNYEVTTAEVHDSQALESLLTEDDASQALHADSAYAGEPIDTIPKSKGVVPQIIERAYRNRPLTEEQKTRDKIKSKTRSRVEHVFCFVTNSMNDFYICSIGIGRAKGVIGLINLAYNLCRYEQIVRLNLLPIKQ